MSASVVRPIRSVNLPNHQNGHFDKLGDRKFE